MSGLPLGCSPSVRTEDGLVLVEIGGSRPRTVPVLSGVGEILIGLAETVGQGLLVGGKPESKDLVNRLLASATGGEDLPRLNVARLRHSWMVALMSAGIPLAHLARLAGVTTFRTFEDLLPYCDTDLDGFEFEARDALEVSWL